jgi:hypothetical protein
MDDRELDGDAAVGPRHVEVLERASEGNYTFNGRYAVGRVVPKTADRVLR